MCKVMVVDDNSAHREIVSRLAQNAMTPADEVLEYASPVDFIHAVVDRGERPDLIVIDYFMPELDGIQALRCVRGHGVHCPAIVLTAFYTEAMHKLLPSNNVKFLMKKPFSAQELFENIQAACHMADNKESVA
ncbi:MAG: response regulator [Armatimonadia bacterium]